MALFEGYADAHGTHGATRENSSKGGKLEIKKTARTVREPVTELLWEQHLSGDRPLGIIPIRSDGMCLWACVDVDRYDIDHAEVAQELERRRLPLLVCRTKSGGAHVYLFLAEPTPAEEVRSAVKRLASLLGWGDCEIFPKQTQILADQGDLANWLNMPYLGGNETERYAVRSDGTTHTLSSFLTTAEASRVKIEQLKFVKPPREKRDKVDLEDGPPCLEILSESGFPDGTRNNGLFALGVFCKKKYGSRWKEKLEEYNHRFMKPPLTSEEVQNIVKNLDKKEYRYTCKDQPLCSHCDSMLCRTRKFGVGSSGSYPELSGLSKLETDPPLWFVDIEERRVVLETDQLLNYREFQKVCAEVLTVYYMPMKGETWASIVSDAMENAIIIDAAPEMSVRGHFMELLEEFCTNKHRGERKEDLLLGRPWLDQDTDRYYFTLSSLMEFLEKKGFRSWGRNTVGNVIEKQLGGRHFFNLNGKGKNVVYVRNEFVPVPEIPLPDSQRDPI